MKIIIHGGFFSEASTNTETKIKKQQALKKIAALGFDYLKNHAAIEAAAFTVQLLEDDPLFNAGTGSQIQSDGTIRMSAALMDGSSLKFGGVINIEKVKNPILVAEKLLPLEDNVLCGFGATSFAHRKGFETYDPETPERKAEFEQKRKSSRTSTVGCVCFDGKGRLAAATSTGGKGFEISGRVSDSATVAGTYANSFCGVSLTGVGEDIVKNAMAAKIVTRVTDGMGLKEAFAKTFAELKEIDGFAGAVAIDRLGNVFHHSSHPLMVFASYDGENHVIFD